MTRTARLLAVMVNVNIIKAGGLKFDSWAGQILRNVSNDSPLLQRFNVTNCNNKKCYLEDPIWGETGSRSFVDIWLYVVEMGLANLFHASA